MASVVFVVLFAQHVAAATVPALTPMEATVGRVIDGDTVKIVGWPEDVRLASIDAPETRHGKGRPGQPFSQASRRALAKLVEGRVVRVQCYERDRFERPVCDLSTEGRTSVAKVMVSEGMAWAQKKRYLRDTSLVGDEANARHAQRGLWSQNDPVPPWEWRKACWVRETTCESTD